MVYINRIGGFGGVYAGCAYEEGLVIYSLSGRLVLESPTRTSIRIKDGIHVEDEVGSYINHSCDPSAKIDGVHVVALRDIKVGEEITFNYIENEDLLASPFKCNVCDLMIEGLEAPCKNKQ
jgi:hypothetical protein